jgi:hypothetical protein
MAGIKTNDAVFETLSLNMFGINIKSLTPKTPHDPGDRQVVAPGATRKTAIPL